MTLAPQLQVRGCAFVVLCDPQESLVLAQHTISLLSTAIAAHFRSIRLSPGPESVRALSAPTLLPAALSPGCPRPSFPHPTAPSRVQILSRPDDVVILLDHLLPGGKMQLLAPPLAAELCRQAQTAMSAVPGQAAGE